MLRFQVLRLRYQIIIDNKQVMNRDVKPSTDAIIRDARPRDGDKWKAVVITKSCYLNRKNLSQPKKVLSIKINYFNQKTLSPNQK